MDSPVQPDYKTLLNILCCPSCKGVFGPSGDNVLQCQLCRKAFPVVAGKPVLIDDERSVFAQADYQVPQQPAGRVHVLRAWARRMPLPSINLSAARCFRHRANE